MFGLNFKCTTFLNHVHDFIKKLVVITNLILIKRTIILIINFQFSKTLNANSKSMANI
jgi:hypothetical protein